MPKVLVSDPMAPEGLEILERARGLEVVNAPDLSHQELLEAVRDAEGLVIRSGTKVTAEVLEAAEKLKVIARAGIGVDNVDVGAASKRGVIVENTPGGNTVTTGLSNCTSQVLVNSVTRCPFAYNVVDTMLIEGLVFDAWSPTTEQWYSMSCVDFGDAVECTGGNNARVVYVP